MILNLKHFSFFKDNGQKWIYFGLSYQKLYALEKKSTSKRLIIRDRHLLNFSKEKKNILEWLSKQNNYYKDSIFWWMNSISSRNNLTSHFFQGISQLSLIKDYLKKEKLNNDITIVAENFHLLKFLEDNLMNEYSIKGPKYLFFYLLLEKLNLILKGLFNYIKLINFFITHYFFSKISQLGKKKEAMQKGEIFLFHDLVNSPNFKNKPTQSRYFGEFPYWLEKNKKKVVSLPWFYKNIKNKKKLYKNLREKKAFIPEDWLNLNDYLNCIKNSIKSAFSINEKIKYNILDISNLIRYEKLLSLSTSKSAIFFRYIPALEKWANKITSIKFFDHFQNQNYEHTLRHCLKKLNIKTISCGYYHSLHSMNYLPYASYPDEWLSKFKPNYIVCSNDICEKKLVLQGVPKKRIKIVSDLQRESLIDIDQRNNENKNLLVILSLFPETNYEILNKIFKIKEYISDKLGLNVTIRSHPYVDHSRILKKLNIKNLPSNWNWSDKDLITDLQNNYCIITMHSAVITDAIYCNNKVIVLKSELNVAENYLDFLDNEFPIIQSTNEEDLMIKLKEIYFTKKNYYKDEFQKIKKKLNLNVDKNSYIKLQNLS